MNLAARGRRIVQRRTPGHPAAVAVRAKRLLPAARRNAARCGARTALQRHVDFFDTNRDGTITLTESYDGLRQLGLGAVRSAAFAVTINAALGWSTSGAPSLTIDTERIHAGRHESDTGVYDSRGRVCLARFRRNFARYGADRDDTQVLTRERLRAFYDGSLFPRLAQEVAARRAGAWAMLRGALRAAMREIY